MATVRVADPDVDAALVAALRYASDPVGEADAEFVAAVREWWISDGRTVLLEGAVPTGGTCGMVTLHEYRRMPLPGRDAGRWGYIGHLFVLPAARGQGVGAALVRAALDLAGERGYRRVVLSPSARSVPLYRRLGFRAADELMVWEPGRRP
ncbi:GNAT family N-acetyltransferase [Tsukamurella sp. 8F]|uniref:GNAT family N-acetyltransferase n=1 Tax=unclassified Tsukamurella TaxID=2633480 RepID=UPI0023B8CABD|nr:MULTISPECIES: GNAT family N-acetyltransferase [unclassified Tsukamurella]MDF0532475.1 GNAT family N-acetyltransferase [Tsukamurella sp. 8J]MDF0589324.1 GNAT family N-acetyltransferase [Tsukamurella sp. 8F]